MHEPRKATSIRLIVLLGIGVALLTSWLQPLYETMIVRGAVLAPAWWSILHVASLIALFLSAIVLSIKKCRLSVFCWIGLAASLAGSVIPGFS